MLFHYFGFLSPLQVDAEADNSEMRSGQPYCTCYFSTLPPQQNATF